MKPQQTPGKKITYGKIFSWNISSEELKNQVDNYDTLSIWKSYRKQVAVVLFCLSVVSFLSLWFIGDQYGISVNDFVYEFLLLYVPLLFFVFRGHLWAMNVLMAVYGFEQLYKIFIGQGQGLVSILFISYAVIAFLHKTIQIEQARRRS